MTIPPINPEQLENAGVDENINRIRRQIEQFSSGQNREGISRIIEETLAILAANDIARGATDLRSIENRYPSGPATKSDIFQTAPGNITSYSVMSAKNLITEERDLTAQQFQAPVAQMDPIRLFLKLGENIPNDPGANFYRSSIIGVDEEPRFSGYNESGIISTNARTYEPQGSVNIIWNLPGSVSERNPRRRVWAKTNPPPSNNSPSPREENDSALQWALAVNHIDGDEAQPVYALSPEYGAWDAQAPNKKPLRKQLVFRNRLPQPVRTPGQGQQNQPDQDNQGLIFNVAKALIDLANNSSPVSLDTTPSLPEDYVGYLRSRGDGGLYRYDDLRVSQLLTIAGFSGEDREYGKELSVTELGSTTVELGRDVNFQITNREGTTPDQLRSVQCSLYDVYLLCRANILSEDSIEDKLPRLLSLNTMMFSIAGSAAQSLGRDRANELFDLYGRASMGDRRGLFADQLNNFVDFEFYNFVSQNPWTRDRFTDLLDLAPGEFLMPPPRTLRNRIAGQFGRVDNSFAGELIDSIGGYINPEYSYYNGAYEAASQQMPEALLPNMYIYELATGNSQDIPAYDINDPVRSEILTIEFGGRRDQRQAAFVGDGSQRVRLYDKLITLDQFENFTLKALGGLDNEEEERESFQQFLNEYAQAVQGSNVTIDFTSRLNRDFYNLATSPDELQMYDNFYKLRTYFPMYIEVGVPCYNTLGPIGESLLSLDNPETEEVDFDLGFKSTGMINSLLSTTSRDINFTINSSGIVSTNFDPTDTFSISRDRERTTNAQEIGARLVRTKSDNNAFKVYDFNEWLDNVSETPASQTDQISKISFRGPNQQNLNPVRTGELQEFLRSVRTNAERLCQENMVKYQDLVVTKSKLVADNETIIYKLVKRDFQTGDVLQNYFFPAGSRTRIIKFVDTQVKYGKNYLFELFGYDIVYGSTFRFRNRWAEYPGPATGVRGRPWNPNDEGSLQPYFDKRVSFSFNVETLPNLKVIEYPIYSFDNTIALAAAAGVTDNAQQFQQLQAGQMGGVSYPIAAVYDRPPLPPESSIFPFQGDKNKILMNFSPKIGELTRKNTVPYISIMPGDEERNRIISDVQRNVENFTLPKGHMEFRSEGAEEIKKVEIFRTTELDMNVTSYESLYRSFENRLHKVLDITLDPDDPSGNYARSFDFIDDIQPNVNYYYTFRMGDVHENVSNPTEIYRVRIDSLEAGSYYVIEEVKLKERMVTKPEKEMIRYIEVQAADIQSLPYVAAAEGDITTSIKSLVESDSENKVENNKFLIRLSSKDTGRKIDIKTSFVVKERRG
jgi:hypothetical protein